MEQSIARSQASLTAGELKKKNWKSLFVGTRSALLAARIRIVSSAWLIRNPLDADISSNRAVDRIAARLAVEDRGQAEGSSELPLTTEEVVAGTQVEIVNYFKQMQARARDQIVRTLQKLRGVGKELDWREAFNYLRDIPSRCDNDLHRITAEFHSNLDFLREREAQQRQNYEAFKKEHKLSRIAKRAGSPIMHLAFMLALFGGAVFALANTPVTGPGGNIPVSSYWVVSISVLAVVVPYFVGASVFRFINHVEPLERLTAWLAGLMTMGFIGALAFFCGNFFVGLAADVDATVSSVIRNILADPSAIGMDASAWRGIAIVGLAGLLAFLVGYESDDPYPGFGAIQRAYYRARWERERQMKHLRRRINTIVDVAEVEVTEAIRAMKARTKQYAELVDQAKRMQTRLGGFEEALEDSCNLLLDRYRSANESTRKTAIPMSFSEHVCFRFEDDSTLALARHDKERLAEIERDMAEFEARAAKIRQELRDLNWRAIDDLGSAAQPEDDPRQDAKGAASDNR